MSQFPVTERLYHAVMETGCFCTRIQILPGSSQIAMVEDPESNTLEIGIPKKIYLALFKEGHTYFNGIYPGPETIAKLLETKLVHIYFATLALLVTTNDHATIWRVHEQVVWEMARKPHSCTAAQDLKFCTALATSRLDNINKSSLLWHWLRKLSVYLIFNGFDVSNFEVFLKQVLQSMEAHLANYACAFSFIWLVQVARGLNMEIDEKLVVKLLRTLCRQKLGDISLWTCYGVILSGVNSPYAEKMYGQMSKLLQSYGIGEQCWKSVSENRLVSNSIFEILQHEAIVEIQWLLDVKCTVALPYKHILHSMADQEKGRRLIHNALDGLGPENSTWSENQKTFKALLLGLVNG